MGLLWYGGIRWAEFTGFSVDESSGALASLFHTLFVYEGEGIDPSYASLLLPLVSVPLISWLTRGADEGRKRDFYAVLAGEKTVEEAGL